jgi:hypothetical protein
MVSDKLQVGIEASSSSIRNCKIDRKYQVQILTKKMSAEGMESIVRHKTNNVVELQILNRA